MNRGENYYLQIPETNERERKMAPTETYWIKREGTLGSMEVRGECRQLGVSQRTAENTDEHDE